MFRGFKVSEAIEFERAVRQIEPELSKEYRGTSPRKQVAGTEVKSCYTRIEKLYFLLVCIYCVRAAGIFPNSATFGDVLPVSSTKEHLLLLSC